MELTEQMLKLLQDFSDEKRREQIVNLISEIEKLLVILKKLVTLS